MSDTEIIRAIRELAGVGLLEARKAMEIGRDRLAGDMVAAAGYAASRGLAIRVRGDREAWNMDRGRARALVWRTDPACSALIAELDALSPIQGPQP